MNTKAMAQMKLSINIAPSMSEESKSNFNYMKKIALALVCILSMHQVSIAQATKNQNPWKDYAAITTLTAAIIAAFHYDKSLSDEMSSWTEKSSFVNSLSSSLSTIGGGFCVAGFLTAYGATGYLLKDTLMVTTSITGITAFAVTGAVGAILKHSFGRERPSVATRDGGFWHGPFAYFIPSKRNGKPLDSFVSFPSGHAISTFSVATVFADAYKDTWVPYASYSLAGLITLSRITEHEHWLSDCIVGAVIGYSGAKIVERCMRKHSPYKLVPFLYSDGGGVTFIYTLNAQSSN